MLTSLRRCRSDRPWSASITFADSETIGGKTMFPKSPQPWLVGPRKRRVAIGADHRLATASVFLWARVLSRRRKGHFIMATKFPKPVKTPSVYIAIVTERQSR